MSNGEVAPIECSCRTKGPVVVVGTEVVCERCRLPRYMKLDQHYGLDGIPVASNSFVDGVYDPTAKIDPRNPPVGRPLPEFEPKVFPTETVDHPAHYGGADDPYEAIKVIEAWALNFSLGCVLKYIKRRAQKGEMIEQLKKARWYLDREIARLEGR